MEAPPSHALPDTVGPADWAGGRFAKTQVFLVPGSCCHALCNSPHPSFLGKTGENWGSSGFHIPRLLSFLLVRGLQSGCTH